MQRVFGASFQARKATQGARKCDVPGIFVTDRGEVWLLSCGSVTKDGLPQDRSRTAAADGSTAVRDTETTASVSSMKPSARIGVSAFLRASEAPG